MPAAAMIGVKPLFAGASLGENANATSTSPCGAGRQGGRARGPALRARQDREPLPMVPAGRQLELRAHQADKRVADGISMSPPTSRPHIGSVTWGRYRLEVSSADGSTATTAVGFDSGFYAESSADTPDLLEIGLDKPNTVLARR